MNARIVTTLALAAFLAASVPASVIAQDKKKDMAAAKKAFKAGQAYMQTERYAEAVAEFKKAYSITKDGLVMGQVAMAYEKAGDYEGALESIKIYRESLPKDERKPADALAKKYEKLIKEGKSKKLGSGVPAVVPTPENTPASDDTDEDDQAGPGTTDDEEDSGGRKGRFYTWIAAGAAGALALSALVVGLNAQSRYDELADQCKPACSQDEVDSVKTRALVSDVLWGTAAAAAVAAGVLFFLEGRSMAKEKKDPLEGDEDDEYSHKIRITPVLGRGTYGLGADIRF